MTTIGTSTQCREPADLLHELDAVEFRQFVVGEDDVDAVVAARYSSARVGVSNSSRFSFAVDLADDLGDQQPAAEEVVDDQNRIALRPREGEFRNRPRRWGRNETGKADMYSLPADA